MAHLIAPRPLNPTRFVGKRPGPGSPMPNPQRRRVETLPNWLHCTLVGTCVSEKDTRLLCKLAGYDPAALTDYERHRVIVSACSDPKSGVPGKLGKMLNSAFSGELQSTHSFNAAELRQHWQSERRSGDLPGVLWAVISHTRSGSDLLDTVYGDMHMQSHAHANQSHDNQQNIRRLTAERNRAKARCTVLHKALSQERAATAAFAQKTQADTEQRFAAQLTAARSQISMLTAENNRLLAKLDKSQRQVLRYQRTLANAPRHHAEQRQETLAQPASPLAPCMADSDASVTPTPSICGRCVLLLGGQTRQCRFMREAVEEHQGHFLHHDGGNEAADARIDDLVSKADIVMCNTNMLSHSAMQRAKRLCQRQQKQIVYVRSASLSAFRRSLERLSPTAEEP